MTKKHGHEKGHAHCEHCLHACSHCNIAYCCDCNKEWGQCRLTHYQYPWRWYGGTTSIPCDTTTIGDFITFTGTATTTETPMISGTGTINLDNGTIDCAREHAHVN